MTSIAPPSMELGQGLSQGLSLTYGQYMSPGFDLGTWVAPHADPGKGIHPQVCSHSEARVNQEPHATLKITFQWSHILLKKLEYQVNTDDENVAMPEEVLPEDAFENHALPEGMPGVVMAVAARDYNVVRAAGAPHPTAPQIKEAPEDGPMFATNLGCPKCRRVRKGCGSCRAWNPILAKFERIYKGD